VDCRSDTRRAFDEEAQEAEYRYRIAGFVSELSAQSLFVRADIHMAGPLSRRPRVVVGFVYTWKFLSALVRWSAEDRDALTPLLFAIVSPRRET